MNNTAQQLAALQHRASCVGHSGIRHNPRVTRHHGGGGSSGPGSDVWLTGFLILTSRSQQPDAQAERLLTAVEGVSSLHRIPVLVLGAMPAAKVLIANRGEIACRVARSCQQLGVQSLVVFTEPDALSLHVKVGDESVCLGASPREYTNACKLVDIATSHGCCAVHPGYGFLSENEEFVGMCTDAGLAFLGPTAETMRMFARKHVAREFAEQAGVPVLPGSSLLQSEQEALERAEQVGYPVLLKATGGGGGIGIYICHSSVNVIEHFASATRQGKASFGDAGVFVEKYVQSARHIEVQIFGNGNGRLVTVGERECSIQRRHQKILEESPSPFVDDKLREQLTTAARKLGEAAKYRSAGTVEFLMDESTSKFYFLEMNTRLQVEHGITELVYRVDLVAWQLQLQVPGLQAPALDSFKAERQGHAIEVRINAEDPLHDYSPSSGILGNVSWPSPEEEVRVDTWVETGMAVTPFYDSLIAKLMVHASSRPDAIAKLSRALSFTQVQGIPCNLEYAATIASSEKFAAGQTTTCFLKDLEYTPKAIEVLTPGMNTTVQDFPGRTKLWHIGVPPSGPMDSLAFRFANALVGNPEDAAGLEITLTGPKLKFHAASVVALTGAEYEANLDGNTVAFWKSFTVAAGSVLTIGKMMGKAGSRAYLAVSGGINVPVYLGSRATFPGGKLGGIQGRPLKAGDALPLQAPLHPQGTPADVLSVGTSIPKEWLPAYAGAEEAWEIGVLPGPNAEPDYFTPDDIQQFYSSTYTVHYNSNRLGVRLQGPRPKFARPDGGEGGSHPSNVHDHVYAIGTINFTGDMPVALMFDGPSLGGFVCPATITSTEIWKMGQVSANDRIRFKRLTLEGSYKACLTLDHQVKLIRRAALRSGTLEEAAREIAAFSPDAPQTPTTSAVLHEIPASETHPGAIYRLAGDRYIFVEYGPMELDLNLRVRINELEEWLRSKGVSGLVETSPGVRSCMIEYDQRQLPLQKLIQVLTAAEGELSTAVDQVLDSRILHLPMAFNERWTHEAISKYMRSARGDAPYLSSNVDFVAANNGLTGGADAVRDIVMKASYMVLGLGDVYLGAPCAVPVDPRHRLVVPKYNPARTFTHEGTVGLGGSYMCIYPMDSPGGYQLVGRTLPIWNSFGRVAPFSPGAPWLLRNFDQVRFFEVSESELEEKRAAFSNGQLQIKIEQERFSMQAYNEMLAGCQEEVDRLKAKQRKSMAKQMELDELSLQRLKEQQASQQDGQRTGNEQEGGESIPNGIEVTSTITASVWEISAKIGAMVEEGDKLVVLEAMKMEYPITAPCSGRVAAIKATASQLTSQGDILVVLVPSDGASEE
ncbi:hypothetical protein WJX74_000026 [Apatococcus lobatus]|uniref:Peptidylprolyl isomerase n=1 Tax=Apatococcus lobatus TaxID=904363 RepID=A0AAW1QDL9_9CHLO